LEDYGLDDVRVAVNNPPGFWLATGMEAVVVPDGDEAVLWHAVQEFDVDVIILDRNVPSGLETLYENPGHLNWMDVIATLQDPSQEEVWIMEVQAP
jgi:hypothetical protein